MDSQKELITRRENCCRGQAKRYIPYEASPPLENHAIAVELPSPTTIADSASEWIIVSTGKMFLRTIIARNAIAPITTAYFSIYGQHPASTAPERKYDPSLANWKPSKGPIDKPVVAEVAPHTIERETAPMRTNMPARRRPSMKNRKSKT